MDCLLDDVAKQEITINALPDNCLELIFTHVNLYEDFNTIKIVSRRWNKLANGTQRRMKRLFLKCSDFSWRYIEGEHLLSERCSHATCFHQSEYAIYLFGGCNNTYTAFNDLWLFDMNTYEWERVLITRHPMPSPKALSTMVLYKGNLLLFGGFSKSSMNPIHQTSTFYNELHQYITKENCWEEIISENTAPHLAGHTASIVGDFMLIFGGSMGSSYNNNVYVLDLHRRIWNMPTIPGPCPPPRYGQSQLLLDDKHLIIIGGCGGPSVNFSDVWLLDFDLYGDEEWRWTQLKVENAELTPPYMWCHRAAKVAEATSSGILINSGSANFHPNIFTNFKVGTNAVVVSRPVKYDSVSIRRNGSNRRGLHRRTSSQSTNSSSGRLTSPDSPSDRRAVAAAFCASSAEQLHQQVQRKRGNLHRDRKPILLTSRSLDQEHQKGNPSNSAISASSSYADLQNKANLSVTNPHCPTYLNPPSTSQKTGELHRACSIPAIIVGEIPKLIVTSSNEASSNLKTANTQRSRNDFMPNKKLFTNSKNEACSKLNESQHSNKQQSGGVQNKKPNNKSKDDPIREYYLSLVKEECNRLRIVELQENLTDMGNLLKSYLGECIPYLTKQERDEIIEEFMGEEQREKQKEVPNRAKGSILELQNSRTQALSPELQVEYGPSTSSANRTINTPTFASSFGPFYGRQMCVFVLKLDKVLTEQRVRWEQLPIEEDAPEDRLLHSLVAGYGELILFGGMFSEGMGMDCLNVGMERYTMSSDTFILKPRYNEM